MERAIKILELHKKANKILLIYMRKSRLCKGKHDQLVEDFVAGTAARYAASLVAINKV